MKQKFLPGINGNKDMDLDTMWTRPFIKSRHVRGNACEDAVWV